MKSTSEKCMFKFKLAWTLSTFSFYWWEEETDIQAKFNEIDKN